MYLPFLSEWCAKGKLVRVGEAHEEKLHSAPTPAQQIFSAMKLRGCRVWDMVSWLLVKPHQPHPWLCPPGWPPGQSVKAMTFRQWPLVLTKGFCLKWLPGRSGFSVWCSMGPGLWTMSLDLVISEGCIFWDTSCLYRLSISWLTVLTP